MSSRSPSAEPESRLKLVAGGRSEAMAPPVAGRGGEVAPDDDTLIMRARGGDRAAFEALVRRHQSKVLAFATRFFGQPALATDVAQEVFLDILRALPRYRPEGRFTIYLYRVTLNRCRMAARARRYEDSARERLWVELADRRPRDEAAAREREHRLQRALLELSEKHRAVLQLRFWSDLSHDEIAAVLDTREGTVKSRLWTALATLREKLGGEP